MNDLNEALDEMSLTNPLEHAVTTGNVNKLKQALKEGADVNILLNSGMSLLGKAIRLGNEDIIRAIIDASNYLPAENSNDQLNPESMEVESHRKCTDIEKVLENDQDSSGPTVHCTDLDIDASTLRSANNSEGNSSQWGLDLFRELQSHAYQKRGCDLNMPDYYDRMPIHYAAETGNLSAVKMLIEAGCLVNVSDNYDVTPLHLAVRTENTPLVHFLLESGSRVNSKTRDKCSALHMACSLGNNEIVEILLIHGANIEVLDASEQTPLLVAAKRGHLQVVETLMMYGAKPNVEEIHGYTPLSEAVWNGYVEVARALVFYGAKLTSHHHLLHYTIINRSYSVCELLIESDANLDIHDDNGDTPLHVAVKCASVRFVKLLLENDCNPLAASNVSGKTPVHTVVEALDETWFTDFYEILELLVKFGANIDSESFTEGETPLFLSILLGKFKYAEELIRHGCNPYLGNVFSCKTNNLDLAIKKKHLRTVKLVIYSGFSVFNSEEAAICSNAHSSEIHSFLREVRETPLSLSKLCRIVIRRAMAPKVVFKVDMLNLPARLKDFLVFKDHEFIP